MIKELTWDSAFFNRKMGELVIPSNEPTKIEGAIRKAQEHGFQYLTCRIENQDTSFIRLLESLGFYLSDIGVTSAIETDKFLSNPPIPPFGKGGRRGILKGVRESIKVATYKDIPMLKRMIKALFLESRFYNDPFFSKQEADKLYQAWIENSVKGLVADVVFCIHHTGFVTCRKAGQGSGEIVLIGIKRGRRGKGFGTALVGQAMEWFKAQGIKTVSVRTQLKNLNAVNFYLRLGFSIKEYDLVFGNILYLNRAIL